MTMHNKVVHCARAGWLHPFVQHWVWNNVNPGGGWLALVLPYWDTQVHEHLVLSPPDGPICEYSEYYGTLYSANVVVR